MQVAFRKASEFQNTATSLSKDFSFLIPGKRKASLDTQIGGFNVNLTKNQRSKTHAFVGHSAPWE